MSKWKVAVALLVLGWVRGVGAHEGHTHRVMGTVAVIDSTHVEIDTTDGNYESYPITPETKFWKGATPAVLTDIKRGTRVVLSVVQKDQTATVGELIMASSEQPSTGGEHRH